MSQDDSSVSLTQKAYLNALSSFLDYCARILVSLVVTPILVTGLGSAVFGIWQVLNRLVGYVSAVDGRPTQALKWIVANQQSLDDVSGKQRAIGSALGVWLLLLPVLAGTCAVLTWASPAIVKAPENLSRLVRLAFFILSVNIILGVAANIPESVLRGMNLGYKRMGIVAGLNILGGLLTAGAIYLNWSLIGVAGAQVMITVITGFLFWHLVKVYVPWFKAERVPFREICRFFRMNFWYSGWNLVNLLLVASDVIVLGIAMSTTAVTEYVLTGYASNVLLAFVTMIIGSAVPGLGGLMGRKLYAKVDRIRNEMLYMVGSLVTVFGSTILLWNQSFISLWVGKEFYAGPWVNLLLVLIVVQMLFALNEAYIINLTLNVRRKVIVGLVSALVSIGSAFILTPVLGIAGLCIAVLAGRMILLMSFTVINDRFLGARFGGLIKTMLRPLFVMTITLSLSAYLGKIVLVTDWISLFTYGFLSVSLLIIVQFGAGSTQAQRDQLVRRMNMVASHYMNRG